MDIRIDSVFSLNPKDNGITAENDSKERGVNLSSQYVDKSCFVSLERIDIKSIKKKYVSYRKWMKTHRHCDSNCFKSAGEKRNSHPNPMGESAEFSKRVTRSSRKRELEVDPNSSVQEPLSKRKKQTDDELREYTNTGCNESEIYKNKEKSHGSHEEFLKSAETKSSQIENTKHKKSEHALSDKGSQPCVRKIKKEPDDTGYESANLTQKIHKKDILSHPEVKVKRKEVTDQLKVKIKTEKKSKEDSFKEICEALSKAPVSERASYIQKLNSILNEQETIEKPKKPDTQQKAPTVVEDRQPLPTKTPDSKTLATLQLVMIDGKSYVVPTSTNINAASPGQKNGKGGRKNESPANKNVNVSSISTPENHSSSPIANLPTVVSNMSMAPMPSLPTLSTNQAFTLPTLGPNQSSVRPLAFSNALPNIGNNLQSNLSSTSNNINNSTSVPSVEKSPPEATEKKEIHGHLVTHPDGKQYFVPLGGGQTFPNKPLIQLEPIKAGSSSSTPLPLGMTISSSSQSAMQQLSSSLSARTRESSPIVKNKTETSLENKKDKNVVPRTIMPEKPSFNESVTEMNKHVAPQILPKDAPLPKSIDLTSENTIRGDATTKPTKSQIMSGNEMIPQIQTRSSTTTSVSAVNSQMQTNPTLSSTTNAACGQTLVPLLINGVVQHVLMNTLPNGTLTLPTPNKPVVTSESINRTPLPNTIQKEPVANTGIQTVSSNVNPVQNIQFGGLQGIAQNQLNTLPILTLNAGQIGNPLFQPGPLVAPNLQPILNPLLPGGQLLVNSLQGGQLGSKGNPIDISSTTAPNVKQSANALPVHTNQSGSVQPQTNQLFSILPSAQILSPTLQGIQLQSGLNQTCNVHQAKSDMNNPVLNSVPLLQQNIQLLATNLQTGNIQTGLNKPAAKQTPNKDQQMTIFLQPDTAKKPGQVFQQPGAPVVPTPQQNLVLNQLQQLGVNVGIVEHTSNITNNSQPLVVKNLAVSSNQSVKGKPQNSGFNSNQSVNRSSANSMVNTFSTPETPGPVSQVLSNLARKTKNSVVTSNKNGNRPETQQVISSALRSIIPSVNSNSSASTNMRKRSYSPTELLKNATKSRDYKNQMEEDVIDVNASGDNIIPMFLKTSTGQVLPFSAVKPYDTITNAGSLVTSLLTSDGSVIASTNPRLASNSSSTHWNSIPGAKPIVIDAQNPQSRNNSVLRTAPMVSQMKSFPLVNDQSNVTLIPAQGYTKSSASAPQLSQNITLSHPLLQQSLRTPKPTEMLSNSAKASTSNIDQTKRNKRKPQVVVHIDKEYPDVQEISSDSPDQDYSMFMVPPVSSSSATKSIVEKGLRIPDSMLHELQKKQLAMESTVQKLKQNKFFSSGKP